MVPEKQPVNSANVNSGKRLKEKKNESTGVFLYTFVILHQWNEINYNYGHMDTE